MENCLVAISINQLLLLLLLKPLIFLVVSFIIGTTHKIASATHLSFKRKRQLLWIIFLLPLFGSAWYLYKRMDNKVDY